MSLHDLLHMIGHVKSVAMAGLWVPACQCKTREPIQKACAKSLKASLNLRLNLPLAIGLHIQSKQQPLLGYQHTVGLIWASVWTYCHIWAWLKHITQDSMTTQIGLCGGSDELCSSMPMVFHHGSDGEPSLLGHFCLSNWIPLLSVCALCKN